LVAGLSPNATLVLLSTDQVYPDRSGPHREGNEGPVNAYGRSKLAGELAAASHGRSLILRTNLFGPSRTVGRESLSDFVTRRLTSGERVDLFVDVLFSPLHMATLSTLTLEAALSGLTGVFNAGSRDGLSKHDFGLAVAHRLGLDTSSARPALSDAVAGRVPRPHDLRLDVGKLEAALGRVMPTLLEEVKKL
jgi:dTDP-4-dehydrorhamnose reductase